MVDEELILGPWLRGDQSSPSSRCGPIVDLATGALLVMQATKTGDPMLGPTAQRVTLGQLIQYVGTGTYNYDGEFFSF